MVSMYHWVPLLGSAVTPCLFASNHPYYIPLHFEEMIFPLVSTIFNEQLYMTIQNFLIIITLICMGIGCMVDHGDN